MLILSILILPFLKPGATLPTFVLPALMVWDFKQLFQISWWRSLWKTIWVLVLNTFMLILAAILLFVLVTYILAAKYGAL